MDNSARTRLHEWHEELNSMSAQERTRQLLSELDIQVEAYHNLASYVNEPFEVLESPVEDRRRMTRTVAPSLLVFQIEQMIARNAEHDEFVRFLARHKSVLLGDREFSEILAVLEKFDITAQWHKLQGVDVRERKNPPRGELIPFPG